MKYLIFLIPLSTFAQVEPTAAIQFGVNTGSMLHIGTEAGVSINRRFTAAVDYHYYTGNYNEHVVGLKAGLATIYKDTDGLCPVYLIAGASRAHYKDETGKAIKSITPTYAVRVQHYNGYWEIGRQAGYWCVTVGYQFRKIYD